MPNQIRANPDVGHTPVHFDQTLGQRQNKDFNKITQRGLRGGFQLIEPLDSMRFDHKLVLFANRPKYTFFVTEMVLNGGPIPLAALLPDLDHGDRINPSLREKALRRTDDFPSGNI